MQCSKIASYSMTSSARASSDGGTVSPSVVAVWVLTTSSNFIGSCSQQAPHAKSAGFYPTFTIE
jgi:hypothetical protein